MAVAVLFNHSASMIQCMHATCYTKLFLKMIIISSIPYLHVVLGSLVNFLIMFHSSLPSQFIYIATTYKYPSNQRMVKM